MPCHTHLWRKESVGHRPPTDCYYSSRRKVLRAIYLCAARNSARDWLLGDKTREWSGSFLMDRLTRPPFSSFIPELLLLASGRENSGYPPSHYFLRAQSNQRGGGSLLLPSRRRKREREKKKTLCIWIDGASVYIKVCGSVSEGMALKGQENKKEKGEGNYFLLQMK